jgi:cytochrome P450
MPVEDMEFEGVSVRKGQMLIALLASANMDPNVFDNPETLNLTRDKNRHVAFGAGPHFCLGAWLARLEMEVFLQRLLDRAPGLQLRIPETELKWVRGTGMRALKALPVSLR